MRPRYCQKTFMAYHWKRKTRAIFFRPRGISTMATLTSLMKLKGPSSRFLRSSSARSSWVGGSSLVDSTEMRTEPMEHTESTMKAPKTQ